jgi:molybdate transport system substrate-binding protein
VIQQKVAAGEKADLILMPVPLIAASEKNLALRSEGRLTLARVGIAVIVRKGATPPDISTPGAVRKMLMDARSIELPPPNGPAGGHLARMIEQLGIAEAVRPKLTIKAAIDGGAQLVADGQVEVAMQLLSEVQSAKDVAVVGLLPAALQSYVVYGTAIPASNTTPEAAITLVKLPKPATASEGGTGRRNVHSKNRSSVSWLTRSRRRFGFNSPDSRKVHPCCGKTHFAKTPPRAAISSAGFTTSCTWRCGPDCLRSSSFFACSFCRRSPSRAPRWKPCGF